LQEDHTADTAPHETWKITSALAVKFTTLFKELRVEVEKKILKAKAYYEELQQTLRYIEQARSSDAKDKFGMNLVRRMSTIFDVVEAELISLEGIIEFEAKLSELSNEFSSLPDVLASTEQKIAIYMELARSKISAYDWSNIESALSRARKKLNASNSLLNKDALARVVKACPRDNQVKIYNLVEETYEHFDLQLKLTPKSYAVSLPDNNIVLTAQDQGQLAVYYFQVHKPRLQIIASLEYPKRLVFLDWRVFAVGCRVSPSCYEFNLPTAVWRKIQDLPCPRDDASLVGHEGRMYVCGGKSGSSYFSRIDCYRISKQRWTEVSLTMPEPLALVGAVSTGEALVVFGGRAVTGGWRRVHKLDIAQSKTEALQSHPEDIELTSEATYYEGKVYWFDDFDTVQVLTLAEAGMATVHEVARPTPGPRKSTKTGCCRVF
jgi:hypothetical protein